ncbi:MAG: alpha/beta hydrolase family protein [Planctomycetales bacterium]
MKNSTVVIWVVLSVGLASVTVCGCGLGVALWYRAAVPRSDGSRRDGSYNDRFNERFNERSNVRNVPSPFSQPLALRSEDYALARQSFQTHLVRFGPSPQPVTEGIRYPAGVQEIKYQSAGMELTAHVDGPPPDGGKRPAVLFLHSGFAFGGDDLEVPQPYRDAGFVVMAPVLRGENGQSGAFTFHYDEVQDALGALETLSQLHYVDSERICICGHGAGGTLAMLTAMTTNRFRAVAALSGTCDLSRNHRYLPFDTTDIREFEMRSPVAYATSFKCPARIYFGSQEVFALLAAQTTADRARQAGLDVEILTVPGDQTRNVVPDAIQKSVEFFRSKTGAAPGNAESPQAEP